MDSSTKDQPYQNVLQELLAATAGGVPPNANVLDQLALALQALHFYDASLGACFYGSSCVQATAADCSLILRGHFAGVGSHCIVPGPRPTAMAPDQISGAITALLKKLDEATKGGETLPQKVEDQLKEAHAALKAQHD